MAIPVVGKEIDAFCGRCKLTLSHTILALMGAKVARVQCNTCGAQHAYRPFMSQTSRVSSRSATEGPQKVILSFEEQLAAKDISKARRYTPKEAYATGDVVQHANFGFGIVMAVRQDKIDVAFKAFEKTLIHGRAATQIARPAFHPASSPLAGASDKPYEEE
jgi:hypothetical protein